MKTASLCKIAVVFLLLLIPGLIWAQSETGQVYVLVRLTDFEGVTTFKSVTQGEFRVLSDVVKKENQALPVAFGNLRKEWRKSQTKAEMSQKGKAKIPTPPFPLKCPAPREIQKMGTFASVEESDKLKLTLVDSETKRVEKLAAEKAKKEAEEEAKTATPQVGLNRPSVKHSIKQPKAVSSVAEKEMLDKLIKEIERVKAAGDSSGDLGDVKPIPHKAAGAKKAARPIHPINE